MENKIITGLAIVAAAFVISGWMPKSEVSNITARHHVQANETVWGIAKKHFDRQNKYTDLNEFVFVIRQKNNLLGNKVLHAGRVLEIPLITEK